MFEVSNNIVDTLKLDIQGFHSSQILKEQRQICPAKMTSLSLANWYEVA